MGLNGNIGLFVHFLLPHPHHADRQTETDRVSTSMHCRNPPCCIEHLKIFTSGESLSLTAPSAELAPHMSAEG